MLLLLCLTFSSPASAQSKKKQPEQFTIVDAQLLDFDGGYPLPDDALFRPGDQIYVVFKIGGYHTVEYEYKMKVSYQIDFVGAAGVPFAPSETKVIAEEIYGQDDDWMPIVRASARIPFHAEAGMYRIVLQARDELKPQSEDRRELKVEVQGREIPETKALTVRDFGLSRAEDGEPMQPAVFKPGDALWGRFSILGFALGEGNTFKVDSRLRIIDDEDEVLYSFEPEGEQGETLYPRRWLPARFNVNLDKDIRLGRYEIELVVHDRVGNQESRARYSFEVR